MTQTVLVKRSASSPAAVYHDQSDEDPTEPKCDSSAPKGGFRQVEKSKLPNARKCEWFKGSVTYQGGGKEYYMAAKNAGKSDD